MILSSWTLTTFLFLSSCGSVSDLMEIFELYSESTVSVRVMSFNILNSGKDVDGVRGWSDRSLAVTNIIRDHSDIAGLQEVLKDQKEAIQLLLGPLWGHIGVGRDDGDEDGEYCSIVYSRERFEVDEHGTFWFSDRPDVAGTKPGKTWGSPKQKRICTWGRFVERGTGRGFYLYNLHLSHNRGAARPLLYRRKSVMLLHERVRNRNHQDEPFVITGDFNAAPTEEGSIGLMLGRTYVSERYLPDIEHPRREETISLTIEPSIACKDTWAFSHRESPNEKTFHGGRGEHGKGWRLDYIFVQSNVGIVKADVLRFSEAGYYPSDHYPITASLLLLYPE